MNINKLSWGLFMFHGKSWWRNLKDIPIFIKRIFFVPWGDFKEIKVTGNIIDNPELVGGNYEY